MTSIILGELVRVIAYGGIGFLGGFLVALWIGDRHRVITEVLDESERDVPSHRRIMSSDTTSKVVVIGLMALMLLTAVVWLRNDQENAAQDRRECIRAVAVSQALRQRTANYLESAQSEQELWRNLRSQLVAMGSGPKSPLVESIDDHLKDQSVYLRHLQANPVPQADAEDC